MVCLSLILLKTMSIQIRWLLTKPSDQDPLCFRLHLQLGYYRLMGGKIRSAVRKTFSTTGLITMIRDQPRGRLGRNGRPGGRNFALNGTKGEVGVSLKKKKKKKNFFFFFFFFFLGRLIFILSPRKCKLW